MRFAVLFVLLLAGRLACAGPADPLGSPRWEDMRSLFFGKAAVVFDERVKVVAPAVAEDSMNVPVSVSADGVEGVEQILVFVDFNPIVKVLEFYPQRSRAYVGFRLKLQQASPIRAAARTRDGVWHVGGTRVDAAGGGCTAPSAGRASGLWKTRLGEVQSRRWERSAAVDRVLLRLIHPMDTGLAAGIPAFYIERLAVVDGQGQEYLRVQTFEPVSENPVFTFDLERTGAPLSLRGVDNNGNRIDARIAP